MEKTYRLKDFDGPLDLLLTLVHKAKIDIREIFVSEITDQYLEAVRQAPDLDMEDASEFIVMAATLIEIKSRAMLPRPPAPEEGEEDPETELIRKLEEYPLPPQETELTGLTLEGLQEAFRRILARRPEKDEEPGVNHYAPRDIHRDQHTVQECMLSLIKKIRARGRIRFEEAFSEAPTREEVVTFFLAVLELLKLGRMHAVQTGVYGEIELIAGKARTEETPEEKPEETKEEEQK